MAWTMAYPPMPRSQGETSRNVKAPTPSHASFFPEEEGCRAMVTRKRTKS